MRTETVVRTFESMDGRHRAFILAHRDGLFSFEEDTYTSEDGYSFWTPSDGSGLYASAEAAERDARLSLPWLRDQGTG